MPARQLLKGEGRPPALTVSPTAITTRVLLQLCCPQLPDTLLHLRMQLPQFWSLSAEKRGSRLFQAAVQGAARELRMLVTAGADTEAGGGRTFWRGTALHFAAREGHVEGARCLVEGSAVVVDSRSSSRQTIP
ncbi:uncharacterized protein LOC124720156 [Schistocerca piceifrons]|uniref:uncharacterized protein LOC124720156 n=1 Tax=Schistocerca piceifrons TaxID=274613 RepID=UPI001F5E3F37|nr:uncharacterized protein LOC124720156 [Schistocerca piceifrons]